MLAEIWPICFWHAVLLTFDGIGSLIHSFFTPLGYGSSLCWTLILLLLMTRVNLCNSSTTSRINYGIIFEKEFQVYFSAEHWTHTYVFKLERPKDLIPIWPACINCTNTDNMLNTNIRYVFSKLNKFHNETIADIDKTIQNIFKLIPSHEFAANRKSRSALPIIGKISKGLFRLATVDDVQKLQIM